MEAKFKELDAVALRADKSVDDPVIDEFLHRNGLAAIPAYFVYPADRSRPPILLEELISQRDVLKALDRAAK